jgi:hypothetical protein
MTVSNRALILLADVLRAHRTKLRTRWRRLDAGQQALLTVAHLRKGGPTPILACGFPDRHQHGLPLPARSPRVAGRHGTHSGPAIDVARGKAFVILDGTLLRIDRVGMTGGPRSALLLGKHKVHGLNVQVLADPRAG